MDPDSFIQISEGFFVNADFAERLAELGLNSTADVFRFDTGINLNKKNIAKHRTRIQFELKDHETIVFLKRYQNPPKFGQLLNWIDHYKRLSTSDLDRMPAKQLAKAEINTPKIVAYGYQWNAVFEKRSFIITEKIPTGVSLEKKLPNCFQCKCPAGNISEKRKFIEKIADFARKFHDTGFRHRDFYLAHIFLTDDKQLYLIDLQRTFKPRILAQRFRIKDLAQLHYSTPGDLVTRSDRLRFYLRYTGQKRLSKRDKRIIARLKAKAWKMADHDIRHSRPVPFAK